MPAGLPETTFECGSNLEVTQQLRPPALVPKSNIRIYPSALGPTKTKQPFCVPVVGDISCYVYSFPNYLMSCSSQELQIHGCLIPERLTQETSFNTISHCLAWFTTELQNRETHSLSTHALQHTNVKQTRSSGLQRSKQLKAMEGFSRSQAIKISVKRGD